MKIFKAFIFSNCKLAVKPFPLLICSALLLNCQIKPAKQILPIENKGSVSAAAIDINSASAEQLEKLPRIGSKTALKIVEFREKYGKFKRPEHLLLIDGISDERFREIKNLVKVE